MKVLGPNPSRIMEVKIFFLIPLQPTALPTQTNRTYKQTLNVTRTWRECFIYTSESRETSITCNVWSTIRCEPYFVGFLANTKGIRNDVCTTVSTVHQCGGQSYFDDQSRKKLTGKWKNNKINNRPSTQIVHPTNQKDNNQTIKLVRGRESLSQKSNQTLKKDCSWRILVSET